MEWRIWIIWRVIFCIGYSRLFQDYIIKKHQKVTDNPTIRLYINKIENRITFRIITGYYLELLTPETIKLLRSTKRKIAKNKNAKNVPNLEIAEVVL